jgi:hypothetical protein
MLAAAALVGACLPGVVRADRLDTRLHEEMPSIVKSLKAKRLTNVGVLPFRVQQGDGKPGFSTPMSSSLATRVENLLIVHSGPKEAEALGVLHDAGIAASKQKVASWQSATGRKKLFEARYPLAWGNARVKAHAFLTGLVKVSKDLRQTTVTLELIDHRDPRELIELSQFTLKSDRNILRDLGYSFALPKKARAALVARRGPAEEADDLMFEQLPKQQGGKKKPEDTRGAFDEGGDKKDPEKPDKKDPEKKDPEQKGQPDKKDPEKKDDYNKKDDTYARPETVGGIKVEMLVDGEVLAFRESATAGNGPKYQVECPKPGAKITFRLTNTTDHELGVVLRLNGVNTINQQRQEPERCGKWILPRGKTYIVKGFLMVGGVDDGPKADDPDYKAPAGKDVIFPFKVLVGAEASAVRGEMGERTGLIEVDVFEPGNAEPEQTVSIKGMEPSKEKRARESYGSLRTTLIKSARLKTTTVAKREIIHLDKTQTVRDPNSKIKVVEFEKPAFVARVAIRVLAPEGGLPTTDDPKP